jgi:hypothetical protein
VTDARAHWWTLDLANAFVSPGVNSRGELVPSHGASRRRLGDKTHGDLFPGASKLGVGQRGQFALLPQLKTNWNIYILLSNNHPPYKYSFQFFCCAWFCFAYIKFATCSKTHHLILKTLYNCSRNTFIPCLENRRSCNIDETYVNVRPPTNFWSIF